MSQPAPDIHAAVSQFNALVRKRDKFCASEVLLYGGCSTGTGAVASILSPLFRVPLGIPWVVDGKTHLFDTAIHIFAFLVYGVPENVAVWTKQGKMGSFISTFGVQTGSEMSARYADMVGHIPQVIVQPCRSQIRAAHNIQLKKTAPLRAPLAPHAAAAVEPHHTYEFWRPILHAKFAPGTLARETLLGTYNKYLLDTEVCPEWTGMIVYPAGNRADGHGVLNGKNRMGKFLMAIRAELQFLASRETP